MNRQRAIISAIVLGVIILLVRPEILGSIFALVFLGMIPGTTLSLPSLLMFAIYAIAAVLVIRWLAQQSLQPEKTARARARKKVLATKTTRKTVRKSAARRVKKTAQA
jgi:membrane protein implicated in regulation of membrane protease activity